MSQQIPDGLNDMTEAQLYNAFNAARAGTLDGLETQLEMQVYNAILASGGMGGGGAGGGAGTPAGFGRVTATVEGNYAYALACWKNLERVVFPSIGDKPVTAIKSPTILKILHKIEAKGSIPAK